MRLSLNQFTVPELPFDAFLELAVGFGFRSVSPWHAKLEAFGLEEGMRRIRGLGLAVCCANAVGGFDLRRPESWVDQWEADRAAVEAAARMGAHCLLVTTGPAIGLRYQEAQSRFLDALAPTLEHAAEEGLRLALEPLHAARIDLSYVHRVEDALDLAETIGSPDLGVCFDLNAAWTERNLFPVIRERQGRVLLVQLSDQRIHDPPPPGRVGLGDGVMPLLPVLDALDAAGYEGPFDLELVGVAQPELQIRRSLDFLRASGRQLDVAAAADGAEGQ